MSKTRNDNDDDVEEGWFFQDYKDQIHIPNPEASPDLKITDIMDRTIDLATTRQESEYSRVAEYMYRCSDEQFFAFVMLQANRDVQR